MSAAARAEARKKAILARGSDRLKKLTTSARGEDAPAYMKSDPPMPSMSKAFVGEESMMPPPITRQSASPSPAPIRTAPEDLNNPFAGMGFPPGATPDPSVWSEAQQQQFLQAFMTPMSRGPESLPGLTPTEVDSSLPPMDNPFAAMMFPPGMGGMPPDAGFAGGKAPANGAAAASPPTRLQKLMPLIHLLTMWLLLAYFVLYAEPKAHLESGLVGGSLWSRWAELGRGSPLGEMAQSMKVQIMPFFWAFTTLQIALHSMRIFSGFDAVQPPMLLSMVLPHLPPPIPSVITNGMKYFQMASLFLDDLCGLLVGIGLIIVFSGWFASNA